MMMAVVVPVWILHRIRILDVKCYHELLFDTGADTRAGAPHNCMHCRSLR